MLPQSPIAAESARLILLVLKDTSQFHVFSLKQRKVIFVASYQEDSEMDNTLFERNCEVVYFL